MRAAMHAEATKLINSLAVRVTTVALIAGVVMLAASFILAIRGGNQAVIARLGPAATDDWSGFLSVITQIVSAGGLGAYAIALGWSFGREFVQGTIPGLFALPVSRARIAAAKLLVFLMWACLVALALPLVVALAGGALGLGAPDQHALDGFLRLTALIALNALVAAPMGLVATLTRSILGAVAMAVMLVVIAQVSVIAGIGAWNPIAIPALWAIQFVTPVEWWRLALTLPYAIAAIVLTLLSWRRLQLERSEP